MRHVAADRRIQLVVDRSSDLACILDPNWSVHWAGATVESMLGYRPSDLIGSGAHDLPHADGLPHIAGAQLPSMADASARPVVEFRARCRDGSFRWCQLVVTNLLDDVAISGLVLNVEDISTKRAARDAAHFQRQILGAVGQPVMVSDLDGRLTYWNDAAVNVYGWSESEALGRRLVDLLPARGMEDRLSEIKRVLRAGQRWAGEIEVQRRDGDWFPAMIVDSPLLDDRGDMIGIIGVVTDLTDQRAVEETQARLSAIITSSRDAIIGIGPDERITSWNPAAARVFGRSASDVLGERLGRVVATEQSEQLDESLRQALGGEPTRDLMVRLQQGRPEVRTLELTVSPVLDTVGVVVSASVFARDVSERTRLNKAAAQDRQRLVEAQRTAQLGSYELDVATGVVTWSAELLNILGLPATAPASPATYSELVHPDDRRRVSQEFAANREGLGPDDILHRIVWRDGTVRWVQARKNLLDADTGRLTGTVLDVTDLVTLQENLRRQSTHDALTGLHNRASVDERLDAALRGQTPVALLLADIDDFKWLNESLGHAAGDMVLQMVADRLRYGAHPGDVVGRFSGDRFMVLCLHCDNDSDALALGQLLLEAVREPIRSNGLHVTLRMSAGVARVDWTGAGARIDGVDRTATDLLRFADVALNAAKAAGKNCVKSFDPLLRRELGRAAETEGALRQALASGLVQVAYQPIVDLADGRVVGAEAVTRVADDRGGWLPNREVDLIAERTGLMLDLGRRVLDVACGQAVEWRVVRPERAAFVSVNLSAAQIMDPGLCDTVRDTLIRTGLSPAKLCLEITESSLMTRSTLSGSQLADLRRLGVNLAVDHFGTGRSGLTHLRRLPLRAIKVDRSYVAGVVDRHEDNAIMAAVVGLAAALGLDVVADGVSRENQLDELRRMGCRYAQGSHFGPALDGRAFTALLDKWEPNWGGASEAKSVAGRRSPPEVAAGDAVRALAHEIRNPLTVALGFAGLLEQSADAETSETATRIRRSAERIATILGNLDDVNAVDAGALEIDVTLVDLAEVVSQVVADFRLASPQRRISSKIPEGAMAAVDRVRISQVVLNLVSNADKFSPPGLPVEVTLEAVPNSHRLLVRDFGPGIPLPQVGQVFRKFARLQRATVGSGLGLYLARGIARAHGGDIRYRPCATHPGAEFELFLPDHQSLQALPVDAVKSRLA